MSEVVVSGGVEVALTEDEARALTDRIKLGLDEVWDLAMRAYQGRAWVALGYDTWDEYCSRELECCRLNPPAGSSLRAQVWKPLADAGMSLGALAVLSGQSKVTVLRALEGGDQEENDPPRFVTGMDGKRQPSRKPTRREVLVRQAKAGGLRRLGYSQKQIAQELGVSQPTVSVDLAEIDRMAAQVDGDDIDLTSVLEGARDDAGRIDAAAIAEQLGVQAAPSRHLSRLVKQPARDLEATLRVVVNEVVMADEWLDPVERSAALQVLMPTTARVLDLLRAVLAALPACDRRGEQWQAIDTAIAELAQVRSQS